MSEKELILVLLGRGDSVIHLDDSVPSYLSAKYGREGAALNLGDLEPTNCAVVAALARAAVLDEEEDVRSRCIEVLASISHPASVLAIFSCIYDLDAQVRLTALECLQTLDSQTSREAALFLVDDVDLEVSELAKSVLR